MDLALQSSWFRKSRFKSGKGKNLNVGGSGLGFKERPGIQADGQSISQSISKSISKSGPATDRLSAMKAAFKSQYQNQVRLSKFQNLGFHTFNFNIVLQFTASSDHSWEEQVQPQPGINAPLVQPESKRKGKKSRWE